MTYSTTTLYIHTVSGDIATESMWRSDFESMDRESWGYKEGVSDDADWLAVGLLEEYTLNEAEQLMLNTFGEELIIDGSFTFRDVYHKAFASADDGTTSVYQFVIDGKNVFVVDCEDVDVSIEEEDTILDYIRSWDYGDMSWHQYASTFGYQIDIVEADEDAENVRIWIQKCYSSGTLGTGTMDCHLVDEHGDDVIFDTYTDARTWIDEIESKTYFLSHGEMGCPTYYIV